LIAGIAGIDPSMGTLGSAAWARYLVDFGLQNEIDAREKPANWTTGYLGIHAADPSTKPVLAYKTEVFQLDEQLPQKALKLSSGAQLMDSDKASTYRLNYPQCAGESAAKSHPMRHSGRRYILARKSNRRARSRLGFIAYGWKRRILHHSAGGQRDIRSLETGCSLGPCRPAQGRGPQGCGQFRSPLS
jgi:hypothetical protein